MNDETLHPDNDQPVADDVASEMISTLQDEVDRLNAVLDERDDEISALETEKDTLQEEVMNLAQAQGDEQLRSLAQTIRTAQRNGHPDAAKHIETLLGLLGA